MISSGQSVVRFFAPELHGLQHRLQFPCRVPAPEKQCLLLWCCMSVWLVEDVLNELELNCLRRECDHSSKTYSLEDYADASCAIDLFENISLKDDDPARSNGEAYFSQRWSSESIDNYSKTQIKTILLEKLPQVLQAIVHPQRLYLFNEHYVVKPPTSNIIFRWHRDIEEQLQCCPLMASHTQYYSLWCPLDAATSENGSLIVPSEAELQTFSYEDLICGRVDLKGASRSETELADVLDSEGDEDLASLGEGRTIAISAGSVIVFSSHLLHCSGPNTSPYPRRVFYSQYSETIISTLSNSSTSPSPPPLCFAIPCYLSAHPSDPPGSLSPSSPPSSRQKRRRFTKEDQTLCSDAFVAPSLRAAEAVETKTESAQTIHNYIST
jgi:hypothetical protein